MYKISFQQRFLLIICTLLLCLLSILISSPAYSATYYVDPTAGNDLNNGQSYSTPWKHLPGTRNSANSDYDCPNTKGAKVTGDDIIYLKSGETHEARKIVINSTYYTSGTLGHPIVIRRKTDWGSGSFTFDATGMTLGLYGNFILIDKIEYITFDGVAGVSNAYDGIIIQNVTSSNSNGALQFRGTSEATKAAGFTIQYVKFYNNDCFNLVIQCASNFLVSYVETDGNGSDTSTGIYMGGRTFGNDTGTLSHCYSHHHGTTFSDGGASVRVGYWLTDSQNITFTDCIGSDNAVRGFDMGMINTGSTRLDNIVLNRCKAYNNKSAGFGVNAEDVAGNIRVWIVNSISYNNGRGIWMYQGPTLYIYNVVLANNTIGLMAGDGATKTNRDGAVTVRNVIFYDNSRSGAGGIGPYTPRDLWWISTDTALTSDYNLFDKQSGTQAWRYNDVVYLYGDASRQFANASNGVCATYSQECHSKDSIQAGGWMASFVNTAGYNFNIQPTSSAISNGKDLTASWPSGILTNDYEGKSRPVGQAWNIGAYEFTGGTAPRQPANLRIQ